MQTEVLIVGAGLSGLALAVALLRRGIDFRLVEARNRIGGRILSAESGQADRTPGCFDLGPSWVWPGQARIERLLEELEIGVFEQYSEGRLVYQDEFGQVSRDYDFSTMAGSLRVDGGITLIVQRLCNQLPDQAISLSHTVTGVAAAENGFVARMNTPAGKQTVKAQHIVLAVPPRVIAEHIEFGDVLTDDMCDSLHAIPTWMAAHAKLVAVYQKPFWRDMGLSGDGISRCGPLMEIHDASPAIGDPGALFGFVGLAAGSLSREPESLKSDALEQLQQMFGAAAADPIDVIIQDWSKEVFTATAADESGVHHPQYGLPPALLPLADKDLYFASTEMASQYGGFIEGALEAAEIALDRIQVT